MISRRLLVVFVALAISTTACQSAEGSTTSTSSPSSAATKTPSELAKKYANGGARTLEIGETATVTFDNRFGGRAKVTVADYTPIDGGKFRVTVTVEAISGTPNYNGLYFVMLTAEGRKVDSSDSPSDNYGPDALSYGELYEGEKASGQIVFDPAGGTPTTIYFAPNSKRLANWKLP